jgi:putative ABC transport system permease protein
MFEAGEFMWPPRPCHAAAALASAVGGTVLGLLEPRLMAGALDLRQFTGGPAQLALRTDYGLLVALVASVTALVLAAGRRNGS